MRGREEELGRIDALFAAGARIVTVTGPPGVGKSALARAYVADHSEIALLDDAEGAVPAGEGPVLAASRELLGVAGERVVEIAPLGVEDAVELFVERVRWWDAAFEANGAVRARVGEIVERVDRLPLAIEIAAERARLLGIEELASRLEAPLDLLVSSRRDVPERQRSMRDAVRWSWERLGEDERAALAELSVFRGAVAVEAAEAVLSKAATPVVGFRGGL